MMVIGKTFAWAHMPKTAGDMTLALFRMFPNLVVHTDPSNTNDKHASFRARHTEIAGKSLLLNIRRLPSWMLSYAHHKSRRGLFPEYTPLSMDSPYQMACSDVADRTLRVYTDGDRYAIDRWLRAESIVDDFLTFLQSFVEIDADQMGRITEIEPINTNTYDKELDHWFTGSLVERMYESNPTWRTIEEQVYGDLVTLGSRRVGGLVARDDARASTLAGVGRVGPVRDHCLRGPAAREGGLEGQRGDDGETLGDDLHGSGVSGMGAVAVTRVSLLPLAGTPLVGGGLGTPESGSQCAGYGLDLVGWVLAREGPVQAVELQCEGLSFARLPQNRTRPDIAALFDVPHGERSGFHGSVSLIGLPSEFELVLKAVLSDNRRVPFAVVHGRRDPLSTGYSPRVRPLMLSNLGRSGSTWLTHVLGCHPNIVSHQPFRYEPRVASYWIDAFSSLAQPMSYYQQIAPEVGGDFWWTGEQRTRPPPDLGEDPELERWLANGAVERLGAFCQRSVDDFYLRVAVGQTKAQPAYFLERFYGTGGRTPFIAWELYPDAKEVFLVRDYRDVLCSILAFNEKRGVVLFGRQKANSDEEFVRARLGPNVAGLLKNWKLRKDRGFLLRYEDLVLEPRSTLSALLAYMDLDCDEATVGRVLEEASQRQAGRQKQHRTTREVSASVGRWRNELDETLKAACAESLWPMLREFGYEEGGAAPTATVSSS